MIALLRPQRIAALPLALLTLAAIAVFVGGLEHARLFHRGYAHVDVVGPLFLVNGIASAVVVLLLVFERVWLFVLGALGISVGAVVSILISHTSSFFGFSESGYDSTARVIVSAEIVAAVLSLLGAAAMAATARRAR